ncbi:MAG: hypothetical protein NC126_11065 [Clostridium sp.]|nr:hypothetical protein [Clostridium sp.]
MKLTYTASEQNAIVVEPEGTLNLCDCNGSNGSHTFQSPATEENVTLTGGMITRSRQVDAVGSGIRVQGTMNMYGGFVAGISDTGTEPGINGSHGAVRVEGTLHMYGGAITHNRSGCGGGVNVCSIAASNALFYLHGGSVSYNDADFDDGGGIECYGSNSTQTDDTIDITGGIITENTTGGETGGGIKCGDINRQLSIGGMPGLQEIKTKTA